MDGLTVDLLMGFTEESSFKKAQETLHYVAEDFWVVVHRPY